jgi:hypothetical protein
MTPFVSQLISYAKKNPYHHLADYMDRFWVRNPGEECETWGARVHNIKRSDYDRALHDHPWWNISIVLRGGYWEVFPGAYQSSVEANFDTPDGIAMSLLGHAISTNVGRALSRAKRREFEAAGVFWRGAGAVVRRQALTAHRLVIPTGTDAWSLFIMGAKVSDRGWGFYTPEGWVHADVYRARLGRDV